MLNVVAIMGRLVADPELKITPAGISVCTFRIACDRNFVQQGQQRQADFIDVVAWRHNADFLCKYFAKGSMVAVQGRPVDIGGYYRPDEALADAVMRPSATLNAVIEALA